MLHCVECRRESAPASYISTSIVSEHPMRNRGHKGIVDIDAALHYKSPDSLCVTIIRRGAHHISHEYHLLPKSLRLSVRTKPRNHRKADFLVLAQSLGILKREQLRSSGLRSIDCLLHGVACLFPFLAIKLMTHEFLSVARSLIRDILPCPIRKTSVPQRRCRKYERPRLHSLTRDRCGATVKR